MLLSNKPKKRLILPIFLIFFLILLFVKGLSQKLNFNFPTNLLQKQEIASPLPPSTPKEKLESLLKNQGLFPESLNFTEKEISASLSGNLTVLFSLEKDFSAQAVSLQFILSRAKIEGKLPKIVDLRFTKPVVSY